MSVQSASGPGPSRAAVEAVARHVAAVLAAGGQDGVSAEELAGDPVRSTADLADLGLDSLGWMGLATRLEDEFAVELPDEALLDPQLRSVLGWARCLDARRPTASSAGSGLEQAERRGHA